VQAGLDFLDEGGDDLERLQGAGRADADVIRCLHVGTAADPGQGVIVRHADADRGADRRVGTVTAAATTTTTTAASSGRTRAHWRQRYGGSYH
jgi:hypothetical protein